MSANKSYRASMTGDIERIREALQFIDASDRDTWLRMGMAIKSELGDTGFDVWEAWSLQAESFNGKDARDVWKSIRAGGKVTIGTLFHEAKAHGWRDDGEHQKPTPEELKERRRIAAERAAKEEVEIARERIDTAKKATAILKAVTEAKADNPYLSSKRVSPVATLREIDAGAAAVILGYAPKSKGEPLVGRLLVVPVKQGEGISTLELIDGDKRKAALAGRGSKAGGYWATERLPDGNGDGLTLLIGEGVATVLSAKEASGHPAIAALSSGNLQAVAKAMRERYPAATLVLLADLVKTTGAPDPHAIEAARAVGGLMAVPVFTPEEIEVFRAKHGKAPTDFNDMAVLHGMEAVKQVIANATTPARGESQPEPDNTPGDEPEARHVNQPRPSEAMLYGLAGDVGKTAAATTEANPYAACMGFMSFLSGMAGRDIYLHVGNTRHHPRLFTLHVGRSSRGRKGDALSLVHRIRHAIDKRESEHGTIGGSLLGQVHTGGLSSREGLVMFIHNGFKQGKDEVPAIEDKRLWVVESEFANILQQSKRDGNTLSPALRDAWDGVSIKPATKSLPLWTTDPHIAIAAAITPTELVDLMKARELSNGFANRFIIFWAERERLIPFPRATSEADLLGLVERTEEVLRFMKGDYPASKDNRAMTMNHEARTAYERLYRGLNATTGSPRLDGILERRAPMLLRMAMLFAMTDLTLTIEPRHIDAAQAWVMYWVDSVRYVFGEAADEASIAERQESADKLLAYLTQKGEATRTEITVECFNKHAPPGGLNAVIAELLNATPPRIETETRPRQKGTPGSPTTIYRPLSQNTRANSAKSANCGSGIGFETLQTTANSVRTLRTVGDATGDSSPDFAEFANSSQHENTDAGRADTHTSQTSHSSQWSTGIIEVEI